MQAPEAVPPVDQLPPLSFWGKGEGSLLQYLNTHTAGSSFAAKYIPCVAAVTSCSRPIQGFPPIILPSLSSEDRQSLHDPEKAPAILKQFYYYFYHYLPAYYLAFNQFFDDRCRSILYQVDCGPEVTLDQKKKEIEHKNIAFSFQRALIRTYIQAQLNAITDLDQKFLAKLAYDLYRTSSRIQANNYGPSTLESDYLWCFRRILNSPVPKEDAFYRQALMAAGAITASDTQVTVAHHEKIKPHFLTLWYQAFAGDVAQITATEAAGHAQKEADDFNRDLREDPAEMTFNNSKTFLKMTENHFFEFRSAMNAHDPSGFRRIVSGIAALLSPANVIRAILYPIVHVGTHLIEKTWQAAHAHGNRNLPAKRFFAWVGCGLATLVTAPFWLAKQIVDPLANSYAKAIEYAFFPPAGAHGDLRALAFLGALGVVGLTVACFVAPVVAAFIKPAAVAISALLSMHFSGAVVAGIIVTAKIMAPAAAWSVASALPQMPSRIARAWDKLNLFCSETFIRTKPPSTLRAAPPSRASSTLSTASSVPVSVSANPQVTQNPALSIAPQNVRRSHVVPVSGADQASRIKKFWNETQKSSSVSLPGQVSTVWQKTLEKPQQTKAASLSRTLTSPGLG